MKGTLWQPEESGGGGNVNDIKLSVSGLQNSDHPYIHGMLPTMIGYTSGRMTSC